MGASPARAPSTQLYSPPLPSETPPPPTENIFHHPLHAKDYSPAAFLVILAGDATSWSDSTFFFNEISLRPALVSQYREYRAARRPTVPLCFPMRRRGGKKRGECTCLRVCAALRDGSQLIDAGSIS